MSYFPLKFPQVYGKGAVLPKTFDDDLVWEEYLAIDIRYRYR